MLFKTRRKGSNFHGIVSKIRKVKILSGGAKIVIYEWRFLGLLLYKKTLNFARLVALDGGGALQFQLSEDFLQSKNLQEKVAKLTANLDTKSKECIHRIIHRLSYTFTHKFHLCDTLTSKELKELKKIRHDFANRIFKVGSVWCYDKFKLPINAFEISVFYHKHSMSVLRNLEHLQDKDIIDVGAFVGDSALILSEFTQKAVHSFELDERNFRLLQRSIALNGLENKIIAHNAALGEKSGEIAVQSGGIGSRVSDGRGTKMISLDEFVRKNDISVGFIKVDIEGAEMSFLRGAKETICTQRPAMLISIYHNARDFFEIKPLIESWNLGYTFKIHKPIDHTIAIETALYCEVLG